MENRIVEYTLMEEVSDGFIINSVLSLISGNTSVRITADGISSISEGVRGGMTFAKVASSNGNRRIATFYTYLRPYKSYKS